MYIVLKWKHLQLPNSYRDISLKTTNANLLVALEEMSEDPLRSMNVCTKCNGNPSNSC